MTREQASTCGMDAAMDDYKQHLRRRLAVHDDALVGDDKSTDGGRQ